MLPLATTQVRTCDRFARPMPDLRISVTDHCNFRCADCRLPEAARPVHVARSRMLTFESRGSVRPGRRA
jgi:cyclic pyranopterin phosphate synthase